mmetsp:Transcript_30077/g.36607  ORF Transcript_30077/g.36607 Transcript_30077/m.36607 type:complete len:108 (-) Transcript_30077:493-816(-)
MLRKETNNNNVVKFVVVLVLYKKINKVSLLQSILQKARLTLLRSKINHWPMINDTINNRITMSGLPLCSSTFLRRIPFHVYNNTKKHCQCNIFSAKMGLPVIAHQPA